MAVNYIGNMNIESCRAAADANRRAIVLWQGWLDSGLGPTGQPLPPAAIPQLQRWVVEAERTAADWDKTADAMKARADGSKGLDTV